MVSRTELVAIFLTGFGAVCALTTESSWRWIGYIIIMLIGVAVFGISRITKMNFFLRK